MTKKHIVYRNMNKKVNVNGHIVEVTTVKGLAEIIGRSRPTILRWEKQGILPPAPFNIGNFRYYPVNFCQELYKIVSKFKTNKTPNADLIIQINRLYKEELEKYAKEDNNKG